MTNPVVVLRSKARNLSDNAKFIQLLIIPDSQFNFYSALWNNYWSFTG